MRMGRRLFVRVGVAPMKPGTRQHDVRTNQRGQSFRVEPLVGTRNPFRLATRNTIDLQLQALHEAALDRYTAALNACRRSRGCAEFWTSPRRCDAGGFSTTASVIA